MAPPFISQLLAFFSAATRWIAMLAIPATGLTVTYHALMKSTAEDDMSALHHARAIRSSLLYGAIAILGGGISSAVLSMFH
ncbi:MAG: hypothetical protein ACM3ZA_06130 [Bacillota bacterium]